jgi:hypothetical protein
VVKGRCSTSELPLILKGLGDDKVTGMDSVAVKCLDIIQKVNCEGKLLVIYRH